MVRSWTGWNRLSVNCRSRQDFPTPGTEENTVIIIASSAPQPPLSENYCCNGALPVSPMIMYLKR